MRWLKLVEGLTCGPCAILIEIIFHTVFEAPYPNFTFLLFCHLAVKCIQKFFNFSVYLKLIFRNFILGIMCFEVCQFSFKICFSSCTIKTMVFIFYIWWISFLAITLPVRLEVDEDEIHQISKVQGPKVSYDLDKNLADTCWKIRLQVIAINKKFPGPVINVTTNNHVIVNVFNELDEDLLISWLVPMLLFTLFFIFSCICNLTNLWLMVVAGRGFKCDVTHGKMESLAQIVQFLPIGIGHISSKSRIKLEVSFTSLLLVSKEPLVALVPLLSIIGKLFKFLLHGRMERFSLWLVIGILRTTRLVIVLC